MTRTAQKDKRVPKPYGCVGFVGLGNLGAPMAANVLRGYDVVVHDLDVSRAGELVHQGAQFAHSVREVGLEADAVVLSLPQPSDVEEVTLQLVDAMRPGASIINISTVSPDLLRRLDDVARSAKIWIVDAPVTGGVSRAQFGLVTMMVGADAKAFELCRPILEIMAQTIVYIGSVGAGSIAKLLANMLWFVHVVALSDALALGAKAGVSPQKLAALLPATGYHGVADIDLLHMVRGDDDESFTLQLSCKDLGLVVDLAAKFDVGLPLTELARQRFEIAAQRFGPQAGALAVARLTEESAGVSIRSDAPKLRHSVGFVTGVSRAPAGT